MNPFRQEVTFHFCNADEPDTDLPGTIILRDGKMILDIPGGCGPYLIEGFQVDHHFEGMSDVRGKGGSTQARWADVNGLYVGTWIEDGSEFLFSFRFKAPK